MSSAEDTSLETASPAATSSEPQPETHAAEPAESEAPELNPAPPLKKNMVAQQVRVTATGVAPGKGPGERELFTEETTSVMVFESGGVIRLSAAVTPGQLLLLTNVESKREVVAQAKRKRAYKPTNCYVELEFAEPAPRFWGTEFSAAAAFLPKDAQDAQAAEMVTSAEATADEPGEPPAAPTAEEVQAFKQEMRTQQAQPNLAETAATSEDVQGAGVLSSTESAANTRWDEISASASIGKSPPIKKNPIAAQWTSAEQSLLPKPSLDFSKSLPRARRARRARGSFTPSFRGGALRLGLFLSALIVTVAGAGWSKHWLSSKREPEKTAVGLMVVAAKENSSPRSGSPVGAQGHSEINNTKAANDVPAASPRMQAGSASLISALPAQPKNAAELPPQPPASNYSGTRRAGKRTPQSSGLAANRSTVRPTENAASGPVAAAIGEIGVVPPKLIKSVRALAPIEAVRDFETGNVVVDAVVGTAGGVNLVSVLSGPPSLRGPAIASLKEYRYEPATRNGLPVPAHVTITIHFRFEP